MKKILITGVFSSGKTSLIDLLRKRLESLDKTVFVYNEVARECPFNLNLLQNFMSTSWLVMQQIQNEIDGAIRDCDFCIYDRGLPDIISHAEYVSGECKDEKIFLCKLKDLGQVSLKQFDYIFVSKRSDNFQIAEDGLRVNDTEFQKSLEEIHLNYLNLTALASTVLVEINRERIEQIVSEIL